MTAKRVVNTLNEIRKSMLNFYVYVFKLAEKYQPQRLDKMVSKHSHHIRLNEEIKDQYEKQSKYLISQLEEAIADRVKLTL